MPSADTRGSTPTSSARGVRWLAVQRAAAGGPAPRELQRDSGLSLSDFDVLVQLTEHRRRTRVRVATWPTPWPGSAAGSRTT